MVEQVVNTGYTRRDDCRLHHMGVGRRHAGKTIAMLVLPDQDLLPDHLPGQRQFEGCKTANSTGVSESLCN